MASNAPCQFLDFPKLSVCSGLPGKLVAFNCGLLCLWATFGYSCCGFQGTFVQTPNTRTFLRNPTRPWTPRPKHLLRHRLLSRPLLPLGQPSGSEAGCPAGFCAHVLACAPAYPKNWMTVEDWRTYSSRRYEPRSKLLLYSLIKFRY